MLRVLREDEERLFRRIAADPDTFLRVSPRLLFYVLMARVKHDLPGLIRHAAALGEEEAGSSTPPRLGIRRALIQLPYDSGGCWLLSLLLRA